MAIAFVAILPILIVYPFLQKYFVPVLRWARSRANHSSIENPSVSAEGFFFVKNRRGAVTNRRLPRLICEPAGKG